MEKKKAVIVGGGFAGLSAAWELRNSNYQVTLLDKRNFSLFQPLLYQVATTSLTETDVSFTLRNAITGAKNISIFNVEVTDFNLEKKQVIANKEIFDYDTLIVSSGVTHNYFGNQHWAEFAPGLKTLENALEIRNKILLAFERAELEKDIEKKKTLLRFIIIGGGATGVELAGSLCELAHSTLRNEFHNFTSNDIEIILIEGSERILSTYDPSLSKKAQLQLEKLGAKVIPRSRVIDIQNDLVRISSEFGEKTFYTNTVIWAAGMKATAIAFKIAEKTAAKQDGQGRVLVNSDLSIPNYPDIFVLGDIANVIDLNNQPLPGIAPVAMQEGKYIGKLLKNKINGMKMKPFKYNDKGNMAVIGKNAAVAELKSFKFSGYPAWLLWVAVHIWYLVGYDNKLMIMIKWAWTYWTSKRSGRLILHEKDSHADS
ncbi:MAG: NAD(P)/FAD-dependent oxidoreductase [Burkholderiales bacterium]|nr:NAD(P)/FAD-dependent oxidoreductase [Burkholderiales bacterium]